MKRNLLPLLKEYKKGAEIGVARGIFSRTLCENIPGLELYGIDPWAAYPGNRRAHSDQELAYQTACKMVEGYNVTFIRKMSADAVKDFEDGSLDFVFIDANHDYEYVLQDITLWTPKVRGIVSGHDYYHFRNSGVIEAVREYAHTHGVEVHIEGEPVRGRSDDEHPCWWFRA